LCWLTVEQQFIPALAIASAVSGQCKKADPQMAHLVLPDTQADPSQNQKSHFFANALTDNRTEKSNLDD
jgi:hypothetical protein